MKLDHPRGLIILDRDGVLNQIVVDSEQGTIDSPLNPEQARIFEFIPSALKQLNDMGFLLAIATNQPAAAKGKTTLANLNATQKKVLELACSQGARVESAHICFHRAEDGCDCRKPKPGLLKEAIQGVRGRLPPGAPVWMVGDGVTDVEAGKALNLKVAFFGPQKCDACQVMDSKGLKPDFWGSDLRDFVSFLKTVY